MTTKVATDISALTLCVIGAGNLGSALVRGFSQAEGPKALRVCDKSQSKIDALLGTDRVSGSTDLEAMICGADVVVLAVKPYSVPSLLETLAKMVDNAPLFLSVAAGVRLEKLAERLPPGSRIARAMPNVAAHVGQGLTGVFAVEELDCELAAQLFSLMGLVHKASNEDQLDVITGASASGQAFVCLLIQALADASSKLGLSADDALRIAAQTVRGASALVGEGDRLPTRVIESIATPGGTTAAGLAVLEQRDFVEIVEAAVIASTEKAKKISN